MYNHKLFLGVILLIFIFTITLENLSAQVLRRDTVPKPKDNVEIIRFDEDENGGSKKNKQPASMMIVKVAPLAFIAGYFPVFVERELNDWLSLQAGLGPTFKSASDAILSDIGVLEDTESYIDYSYRKARLGMLFTLSPRLYFDNDGFEGGFIAPEVRISSRNLNAQKPDPSSGDLNRLEGEYDKESTNYFDLMVHYGRQTLYPKLTLDWSIGVGIRNVNSTTQNVYQNNAGNWTSSLDKNTYSLFHAQLGLRLGFQL